MSETLYQKACRLWPHNPDWTRQAVHRSRAKYIRAVFYLGDKWILHKAHFVKNKTAVSSVG